jgi:hypothetical protein
METIKNVNWRAKLSAWWSNVVKELLLTFSNQTSRYSSKKIERFIVFINALVIANSWFYSHIYKATVSDVILLTGALLAYGGWNTAQIRKDKLDEK